MLKKAYFFGILFAAVLSLNGCATGRNQQSDIDALNARLTALQGQLSSKEHEISSLNSQLNEERDARQAAEAALRDAEVKRLSQKVQAPESDLK